MSHWLTLTLLLGAQAAAQTSPAYPPAQVSAGQSKFIQDCGFCHGRDAGGGEDGPDLTRSKLVAEDKAGNKIGPVVRNGRPQNGMPRFTVSDAELSELVAFIHTQKTLAETQKGGRRGVDPADLRTGNADAGKRYFEGAGGCTRCHSAAGDLADVATRLEGLKLEERLMYPKGAKSTVVLTLPSGETVAGDLAYQDEFTVAVRDKSGWYRSFPASKVKFKIDSPADAHVELMSKYTDDDIHNLMAYLQTLR
jgi:cytochrome c oxidase cbb3-type subunit 3